jgi:hypothetical protein
MLHFTLQNAIVPKLIETLPMSLDRALTLHLTHSLTHSLSRSVTSAATISFSIGNKPDTFNPYTANNAYRSMVYYSIYYSVYYSDYYAVYYTPYYTKAQALLEKQTYTDKLPVSPGKPPNWAKKPSWTEKDPGRWIRKPEPPVEGKDIWPDIEKRIVDSMYGGEYNKPTKGPDPVGPYKPSTWLNSIVTPGEGAWGNARGRGKAEAHQVMSPGF